jgi:hypothetical protein
MKPIRVITQDFELLTEIDQYDSLLCTRRWNGIGEVELKINRHMKDVHLLIKGRLLILGGQLHKAHVILHREIELDENGKASENWIIKALSIKSILARRITVPPLTTGYDNKQGPAETVIKHYVYNNVVTPINPDRIIPNLMIAEDLERGSTLSWQSRFKNLSEELVDQSISSELGWNISLDMQNKGFVFDVEEGKDLTTGQTLLPPVIFSPQFALASIDCLEVRLFLIGYLC